MGYEVELKLSINKSDAKKLHQIPLLVKSSVSKHSKNKLISNYFDTPDLKLLDAGIALRIRQKSGKWIQTVKLAGVANSGLHQRNEWEDCINTCHPDFSIIKEPFLSKVFADHDLQASLIQIFRTEIMREEWLLSFDNGDQVELSVDSGFLKTNEFQEAINEIELELKAGHVARVFDIALEIQQSIPLSIQNTSKAERGYEHYRPSVPQPCKAKFPDIDKNIDANSVFKIIVRECIDHLESNRDIVINQADIEGVHQMRVALRRLRSAFSLFEKLIKCKESQFILTEVSWLANKLGKVRDLDVLISEILPMITDYSKNHDDFLIIRNEAIQTRELAHKELQEAIMSQRYHRLLLTLSSWLESERWNNKQDKSDHFKILNFAKKSLNKFYKPLGQNKQSFKDMRPEDRHKIRIAAKKLRYAIEFFYHLFPDKEVNKFIKKLAQLQDGLGKMNDVKVAINLVSAIPKSLIAESTNETIKMSEKWGKKTIKQQCSKVDSALKKLLKEEPFWTDVQKQY